ncbi:MAG: hemolysin family protein [Bryobacteraceae bacterium]
MTYLFVGGALVLATVLMLATYIQLLYMESLRLRTRESAALEHFKDVLEDKLRVKGDRGVLVYSLLKHTSLLLLGIDMVGVAISHAGPVWGGYLEATLGAWLLMLLSAYMAPPTLYKRTNGRWVLPLVPLLRLLALLVWPLVGILEFFQSLAQLGKNGETAQEEATPAEHIDALIAAGAEEGLIEEDDRRLIQSVVAFRDKRVREVMTARPNIVSMGQNSTLEELRGLVINEQYSRIPVYEGDIDHILGFIHVRDMFELDPAAREHRKVKELIRPIRFVPESKPVDHLMREMQADRAHMCVVVDEYGNTAGLATMEDLVEEILGEISDEHEPTRDMLEEPGGTFVVSGSFDVDHLREMIDYEPELESESTTVGGLATEWLGHVPAPGEVAERDGVRLEVLAGSELRVERVRVSRGERRTTNE